MYPRNTGIHGVYMVSRHLFILELLYTFKQTDVTDSIRSAVFCTLLKISQHRNLFPQLTLIWQDKLAEDIEANKR
jgi:hypothetical protein